jgi:Ti-type conjugative transfer relaxase TraA
MSGSGKGDYYLKLSREDYYLEGGEPPGKWAGRGTEQLGLEGQLDQEQFRNVMSGKSPDGKKELVQNAGKEDRQSGWDLTFSAPKSVSVAWSQSEGETRKHIQEAHRDAVGKALQYLDENAGFTRRGRGGIDREAVGLTIATFEHGTSRAQDPQLHTHALVLNVSTREDGTTGTIESKPLFQNKMAAGAIYRAELAAQLEQRLGLQAERKKAWFELKGVDPGLADEFSKRRKEVEAALEAKGFGSAQAAKVAALNTRGEKDHIPREVLFAKWQEVGKERGWSTAELKDLTAQPRQSRDIEREKQEAVDSAVAKITAHQSHFSERDLIRTTAEEAQGRGIGADAVLSVSKSHLENSSEIVALGKLRGEERYTTKEMLALEAKMLGQVEATKQDRYLPVSSNAIEAAIGAREGISAEQVQAVRHLTEKEGRVQVVSGMAGTGKSYMLGAVREAWERQGYKVYGAALSGKAAQGLQDGAGIQSETIHKTLFDVQSGRLALNSKSVLVVDEAGMVGTRQMAELVEVTERAKAKLVLVGDARQLQPVDAGGPFKAIAERVGQAELIENRRQKDDWTKKAVAHFSSGDAAKALEEYAKRGLVSVAENRDAAIQSLVNDWKGGGVEKPQSNLILASSNAEAKKLNASAQEERYKQGKLSELSLRADGTRFYEKDRILFTKNSRLYGVRNGQLGTVEQIDEKSLTASVRLDSGKQVKVPVEHYPHIRLGYAVTTHKSQGMTAENTFILAGGSMQDRELSYVQASRASGTTRFYTDKLEAGENLTQLSRAMSISHQKDLASSIKALNTPQIPQTVQQSIRYER